MSKIMVDIGEVNFEYTCFFCGRQYNDVDAKDACEQICLKMLQTRIKQLEWNSVSYHEDLDDLKERYNKLVEQMDDIKKWITNNRNDLVECRNRIRMYNKSKEETAETNCAHTILEKCLEKARNMSQEEFVKLYLDFEKRKGLGHNEYA